MAVQVQFVDPSALAVPLQVPLPLIPLNFPVPPVYCHMSEPDCIWQRKSLGMYGAQERIRTSTPLRVLDPESHGAF